jgi:hypothetical protein
VHALPDDWNWTPKDTAELLVQTTKWCRDIVSGDLQPGLGAARIWAAAEKLRANDGTQWPEALWPFIVLASEQDEVTPPDEEADRLVGIRLHALRFLDEQ